MVFLILYTKMTIKKYVVKYFDSDGNDYTDIMHLHDDVVFVGSVLKISSWSLDDELYSYTIKQINDDVIIIGDLRNV